jgi:hypothetical protein
MVGYSCALLHACAHGYADTSYPWTRKLRYFVPCRWTSPHCFASMEEEGCYLHSFAGVLPLSSPALVGGTARNRRQKVIDIFVAQGGLGDSVDGKQPQGRSQSNGERPYVPDAK